MEVYHADLMGWDLGCALWCLEEHARRSEWWPTWAELVALATEWRRERAPIGLPALPPARTVGPGHEPFATKRDWVVFCEAMAKLRDTGVPVFGGDGLRLTLLSWGEKIEARQRPHAEQMGWL